MRVLRLVEESHHRDAEGRPLREGRTPPEHLRDGDLEYKPCHYAGSRHLANPMNVSALRQSSAHWDAITDTLAALRARYADLRGSYAPDVMDVWRVSQLACALPWWFILRGETAPAHAAALSKITLGTAILSHRLLHDVLREQWTPPPLTADALLALAESTGTLLGDAEVCAAPAKMIADFLDVLVTSSPGAPPIADDIVRFGAHYTGLKQLLWIHFHARRFLYADVGATDRLAAPCEPPDCVVIEPPALAPLAPPLRAAWFTALAALVIPLAPDGSDRPLAERAREVAHIMGAGTAPVATFHALDASLGEVLRVVERGLGGADVEVDAAVRDRLMGDAPRDVFGA